MVKLHLGRLDFDGFEILDEGFTKALKALRDMTTEINVNGIESHSAFAGRESDSSIL